MNLMPTIAESLQLAIQCHQAGNLPEATRLYRLVLEADSSSGIAHYNLGSVLLARGLLDEAGACFQQALQCVPNFAEAEVNLGNVFTARGQLAEAARCYRRAVQLAPNLANAHYNLGTVLLRQGQLDDAARALRRALELSPDDANTHYNLGNVLKDAGRRDESIQHFRSALAIDPRHAGVLNNLGNALREEQQLGPAIICFQQALALNPNDAHALNNLGNALVSLGRRAEGTAYLDQSLRLEPDNKLAQWNRGLLRLQDGDLAGGWPPFENRWAVPGVSARTFHQPRWDGSSFQGKTILVYGEQGLGDTIHFMRYLPMVKARGGTVLFECQPPLYELLRRIQGPDQILPAGAPLPPFDLTVPLMSLPGIFGTTLSNIPARHPYLVADARHAERWSGVIKQLSSGVSHADSHIVKVGIAWKANSVHPGHHLKSCPLRCFAPCAPAKRAAFQSPGRAWHRRTHDNLFSGSRSGESFQSCISGGPGRRSAEPRFNRQCGHRRGSCGRRAGCACLGRPALRGLLALAPGP